MASIDLLEELKLNNYFPQKLSFSEAIQLRGGESQTGSQDQYGLEIVRKLLMFDSTAVVSVTTELNNRLNNIDSAETETKHQCVENAARPPRKSNFRPSWRMANASQNERIYHPMDLLVVVMNCCDDFLRQVLVEKMFANKLSIPILLPDLRNGSYTLLLFALRSLVPEVPERIRESSASLTDTLVDAKNPVVSFIRVGNLHRSKSKLVNDLLDLNSFGTFFHRECPEGSAKRLVSNGSIEAAWFQSSTATLEEFNCRFFTVLNLRGDARDYPKQTQFLCQSSTLVVFMVDSFESFKELYENVLKDADVSQTSIIVNYVSPVSPDKVDEKYFEFLDALDHHGAISQVKYDWLGGTKKMSDNEFTNDLRKAISVFFTSEQNHSNQMPPYIDISRSGKKFGFIHDEDKFEYDLKASVDEFVKLVLKQTPDCKQKILPLQGEPWKRIGKLEREQRGKGHDRILDETFIAEKETEKRRQRVTQCRSLIRQNEITLKFSVKFQCLQDQNLLYFLDSCKIKLDARSQNITSNFIEEYKNGKQVNQTQLSNEGEYEEMEVKIANSAIGLEHILREHGQMYEAVISEEIRMKEELKNAPIPPEVIRNFPTIVAKLLLKGQPLELMDGDASNVPITWLKAVFDQIRIMTNNAKVFVLSIIGVQSSGKSTLLNALFGLQFPVSAGRCTKGIYCHLVPVDKGCLNVECDYVLVVDTEGLGASEFTGKSMFRDNELATFAIGLADATIINMKGENWAEMKDILQIVAYGLVRIRKTKADLELMPRCMFVHQNVSAPDAEDKNRLGQGKQLTLLDTAIKAAVRSEGFTDTNKFNDVIKYDPELHSWYFPDLWYGKPPRARTSPDYTGKSNELRKYLIHVMKGNPSKLRIWSFFHRLSDLWNAMLHNDFVLSFRNTKAIMSGMVLNDRIAHEVDGFKNLNKPEQTKIRESICSFVSVEELRAEKERILREVSAVVEKNFTQIKTTLQGVIDASDICAALKQKYEISFDALKDEELRRIKAETAKDICVHMKKLEFDNNQRVKYLKTKIAELEKRNEEVEKDKLNEVEMKEFEEQWHRLIAANKRLVESRISSVESKIKVTISGSLKKLNLEKEMINYALEEMLKTPLVFEMPQVTENDIFQNEYSNPLPSWVIDFVYSKSHVYKAKSSLHDAHKRWELQFQNQTDLEFDASRLEEILLEVGQLLGISKKEESEVRPAQDEIRSVLPPGYSFTRDYVIRFIKFVYHHAYNRSLENSKRFISVTDPLADIGDRFLRSLSRFQQMTVEANIDAVSQQLFDYAKSSFVKDLDNLIKREVCTEENGNPTFNSKRAFLRAILTDLGQRTHNLTDVNEEKKIIFKEFMLYVEHGKSVVSEDFFLNAILKLLKEMLTKESTSDTVFQRMVENNVGRIIEKTKNALSQADTNCNGCTREYVRIFKHDMSISTEIDFRINTLHDFTNVVQQKIEQLYADFLNQANSSFETFACVENRAAIRPLFVKIMGCRDKCPFCSAPCSESLHQHAGVHSTNHYPMGVGGTVDISGLLYSIHETHDVTTREERKRRKLTLDTCQTIIGTRVDFRTTATVEKFTNWYHILFNWNYQSFKDYKEIAEYKNWDIPHSQDHKTSLYWKWFIAQFGKELAEHYNASCPEIPEAWERVTWEEAKDSLDEPDLNFQFEAEEQC